ncbi:hypothetical protein M770_08735 [Pseudomonas aeruginosa VRFPA03]|nr:hypothetical protein M770_08735 [Pseudomonas aeruginosa VRFPA03]
MSSRVFCAASSKRILSFCSTTGAARTRLFEYFPIALAIAWFRLKQRKELSAHERQRIRRIEILVLLLILLIEFSKAYFRTGGAA